MTEIVQDKPAVEPRAAPASAPRAPKKIIYWADLIRVLAIYLVVIIHVSGQLTNLWGKVPLSQWLIADIYGGVARVGVPLFFMLSGYLLLPRTESLRAFYSKRMLKIVIPFIVWSIIYISIDCAGRPGVCTWNYLLPYILLRKSFFHLWFLYTLIGIYLIMPVLRLMSRPDTNRTMLWYLIGMWIIFQPIRTLMDQFLGWDININAQLTIGFLPYFILGYLLGEMPLNRRTLSISWITFAAGALIAIVGTYLMTLQSGQFSGYFYDYMTIGVILATGGAFMLLRRLSDVGFLASERFHSFTRTLSGSTFGLYLVHVLFLWALDRLGVNAPMGLALWTIPVVATLVYVLAFFAARLLQKIPIVNTIVPG